jgi:hypothetical protein
MACWTPETGCLVARAVGDLLALPCWSGPVTRRSYQRSGPHTGLVRTDSGSEVG